MAGTRKLTGAVSAARKVLGGRKPVEAEPVAAAPVSVAKKAVPAKRAAPAKKAAPAAKKAPAKKVAPATKAAPAKKVTKAAEVKAPVAKKAPAKAAAAKVAATKPAAKAVATKVAPAAKKAPAKKAAAAATTAPAAPMATVPVKRPAAKKAPAKKSAPALRVLEAEDPWTKAELAEIVAELTEMRTHSLKVVADLQVELDGLMRNSGDGAGQDQADVGATSFERDQELTVLNGEQEKLAQIERAFHALDEGTYGICESCGNPIGKNRLLAFPRATLCMDCKRREERR